MYVFKQHKEVDIIIVFMKCLNIKSNPTIQNYIIAYLRYCSEHLGENA